MTIDVPTVLFAPYTQATPVDFYHWDPNGTTRIHLVEKATGKHHPITYEARAFAVFHHINAYEEDGQVRFASFLKLIICIIIF